MRKRILTVTALAASATAGTLYLAGQAVASPVIELDESGYQAIAGIDDKSGNIFARLDQHYEGSIYAEVDPTIPDVFTNLEGVFELPGSPPSEPAVASLPRIELPEGIELPDIEIPDIEDLPQIPDLVLPEFPEDDTIEGPTLELPAIQLPDFDLPELPGGLPELPGGLPGGLPGLPGGGPTSAPAF